MQDHAKKVEITCMAESHCASVRPEVETQNSNGTETV